METFIPDVYEDIVGIINITTLTNRYRARSIEFRGELLSKFIFLADKVGKAADSNRDCGKYDI